MAVEDVRQDSPMGRERDGSSGTYMRSRDRRGSRVRRRFADMDEGRLAMALGWFGIGLGLVQIAAPGSIARLVGLDEDDSRQVMRAVGLREIATGIGILSQPRSAGWVWARVGGDVVDMALLGRAMASDDGHRERIAVAMAAVTCITALDLLCGRQLSQSAGSMPGRPSRDRHLSVTRTVTINRPAEELYAFWRDFRNLPRFMRHVEAIEVTGDTRSHWRVKGPAGMTVEWDAEITDERPNEFISWRSVPGADVDNEGTVRFERAPGGRGTIVRAEIRYTPPGGPVGAAFAKLFGEEPGQQAQEDLRAFKQVMETGEVTRSQGSLGTTQPAQPPADGAETSATETSRGQA